MMFSETNVNDDYNWCSKLTLLDLDLEELNLSTLAGRTIKQTIKLNCVQIENWSVNNRFPVGCLCIIELAVE